MASNVELYEALKDHIGNEAARMLAESIPETQALATKADIADVRSGLKADIADVRSGLKAEIADVRSELKAEIAELRQEMRVGFEQVKAEIRGVESSLMRWMLTFFVPLWLGVWAVVLGLVLAR